MTPSIRGNYRPCPTCKAPIRDPFPADWEIEMVKEGPPEGPVKTHFTPHTDACDAPYADPCPGVALRVSGAAVTRIGFSLAPQPATAWFHGSDAPTGEDVAEFKAAALRQADRPPEPLWVSPTDYRTLTAIGRIDEGQLVQETPQVDSPPDAEQ